MDIDTLIKSSEWCSFQDYCDIDKTLFGKLRTFNYEDIHTNLLSYLFSVDNNFVLKEFFKVIYYRKYDKDFVGDFDNLCIINNCTQKKIGNRFIDLFVEFSLDDKKYFIALENKLFSAEHDKQCEFYFEKLDDDKDYNDVENKFYIFLTLDKSPKVSDDNFLVIGYQDIVDIVDEYRKMLSNESEVNYVLDNYLQWFSFYYNYGNDYDIPITRKSFELAKKIVDRHEGIIINLLVNKVEVGHKEEFYNLWYVILKKNLLSEYNYQLNNKVYGTRCSINGVNLKYYKDLCFEFVKCLINHGLLDIDNLDKLNDCFPGKNYFLVLRNLDVIPHAECYESLTYNDSKIYYYNSTITYNDLIEFRENLINNGLNKEAEFIYL